MMSLSSGRSRMEWQVGQKMAVSDSWVGAQFFADVAIVKGTQHSSSNECVCVVLCFLGQPNAA